MVYLVFILRPALFLSASVGLAYNGNEYLALLALIGGCLTLCDSITHTKTNNTKHENNNDTSSKPGQE